jgi:hypothetical protein
MAWVYDAIELQPSTVPILQQVARLAPEFPAKGCQRGEEDGTSFIGFEYGTASPDLQEFQGSP